MPRRRCRAVRPIWTKKACAEKIKVSDHSLIISADRAISWHETDMPTAVGNVCFRGRQSGKHLLALSFSGPGPGADLSFGIGIRKFASHLRLLAETAWHEMLASGISIIPHKMEWLTHENPNYQAQSIASRRRASGVRPLGRRVRVGSGGRPY
jgi:hypothetical protein